MSNSYVEFDEEKDCENATAEEANFASDAIAAETNFANDRTTAEVYFASEENHGEYDRLQDLFDFEDSSTRLVHTSVMRAELLRREEPTEVSNYLRRLQGIIPPTEFAMLEWQYHGGTENSAMIEMRTPEVVIRRAIDRMVFRLTEATHEEEVFSSAHRRDRSEYRIAAVHSFSYSLTALQWLCTMCKELPTETLHSLMNHRIETQLVQQTRVRRFQRLISRGWLVNAVDDEQREVSRQMWTEGIPQRDGLVNVSAEVVNQHVPRWRYPRDILPGDQPQEMVQADGTPPKGRSQSQPPVRDSEENDETDDDSTTTIPPFVGYLGYPSIAKKARFGVVCIEGNIGSGKTTLLRELA